MTTPIDSPWRRTSIGAAGVGSTPASSASPPAAVMPAAIAASSISPDSRVSRTTSTPGRWSGVRGSLAVAVRASASASSAVRNSPARPRTPSVPNIWRAIVAAAGALALGELRALPGLLEAGLLALLHARVAREEPAALELAAEVRVGLQQRARDPVTEGAGLRGDATAVHPGDDVHPLLVADGLERLADDPLQRGTREELIERLAVDRVAAGARLEDHPRHRGLALAGGGVARAGREVDRRVGDRQRLVLGLLLGACGCRLGLGLGGRARLGVEELLALGHDVRSEVGARNLGLLAWGELLLEILVLGRRRLGGGRDAGLGGRRGRGAGLRGRLALSVLSCG